MDVVDVVMMSEDTVLLDPRRNNPMKTYLCASHEIQFLSAAASSDGIGSSSWVPPLRLSLREKEVRTHEGTVMILGRSGTGICTCFHFTFKTFGMSCINILVDL